jgi:hypothetical protein
MDQNAQNPPPPAADNQSPAQADQVIDTTKAQSAEPTPAETSAQPGQTTEGSPAPTQDQPITQAGPGQPPQKPEVVKAARGGPGKLIKKILPLIFIVAVVAIAAFAGYFFGQSGKKAETQTANASAEQSAQQQPESSRVTSEPTPTPIPPPTCISGYKPFISKEFSLCYPINMVQRTSNIASSSAQPAERVIFEDEVETLTIEKNFNENLNRFECVSNKSVKVSGFQALRYLIKDKSKTGTSCGSTINTYATLVSAGSGQPVYLVGLAKKSGSYQSDNGVFAAIEASFKLNQVPPVETPQL